MMMANQWKELSLPRERCFLSFRLGTGIPESMVSALLLQSEVVVVMNLVIESGSYVLDKFEHIEASCLSLRFHFPFPVDTHII